MITAANKDLSKAVQPGLDWTSLQNSALHLRLNYYTNKFNLTNQIYKFVMT
jgi:hypothetical protein